MANKRTATEACRSPTARSSPKRQRTPNGTSRQTCAPRPPPAGRPPRMPHFEPETPDKALIRKLNLLTGAELVAFLRDVELRYRKVAKFEAEEIRLARTRTPGFGRNSPLVVRNPATVW